MGGVRDADLVKPCHNVRWCSIWRTTAGVGVGSRSPAVPLPQCAAVAAPDGVAKNSTWNVQHVARQHTRCEQPHNAARARRQDEPRRHDVVEEQLAHIVPVVLLDDVTAGAALGHSGHVLV